LGDWFLDFAGRGRGKKGSVEYFESLQPEKSGGGQGANGDFSLIGTAVEKQKKSKKWSVFGKNGGAPMRP